MLIVVQGEWGERIAAHIRRTAPETWQVSVWQSPTALPQVLDEPEEFLPSSLPAADLLLSLTESAGLTDLTPDIATLCGARAVLLPVDRRSWAPPGLRRQVARRLQAKGIGYAAPMPFCSLSPGDEGQHPLIATFARLYGRPELRCTVQDDRVAACVVVRGAPCGNTHYIAERLVGTPVSRAPEKAGLLHHYYPCWGGMEADPTHGTHTLLHIAATMSSKAVSRALERATVVSEACE